MTRIAKLFTAVAANPRAALSFSDFERLVRSVGYVHERTRGSHRHFRHPKVPYVLTIVPRGKDAVGYQVANFIAMCEEFGLAVDD